MIRDKLDLEYLNHCIKKVTDKIYARIKETGDGTYAGPHETYGIIAEEFDELRDAMRANDANGFRDELIDLAVACIVGLASSLPADTSARSGPGNESKCKWTQEAGYDDQCYHTSCGNAFYMNDGTPKENDMEYCCFCGEEIDEIPYVEEND